MYSHIGTSNKCLHFGGSTTNLQSYIDLDLLRDIDTKKSATSYLFTIGVAVVSWVSRLQKVNALSTTKVEYVATIEVAKEMIWLQFFLEELGHPQKHNYLFIDSQSAIHLENNSSLYLKTKYIQLRYHFIQLVLDDGELKLDKMRTNDNPINIFTKVVTSSSTLVGFLD